MPDDFVLPPHVLKARQYLVDHLKAAEEHMRAARDLTDIARPDVDGEISLSRVEDWARQIVEAVEEIRGHTL